MRHLWQEEGEECFRQSQQYKEAMDGGKVTRGTEVGDSVR